MSQHAEEELLLRQIAREQLDSVIRCPQQVVPERVGRKAYQSQIDIGGGRVFLLRAIVDDTASPAVVVTVYRTRKIKKYWQQA